MRERYPAHCSGSGRGSGSVSACERECQSPPRPQHRLRGPGTERPRVRHGGRPYWKRARDTSTGRWPARGGARPWGTAPTVLTPGQHSRLSGRRGLRGLQLHVPLLDAHRFTRYTEPGSTTPPRHRCLAREKERSRPGPAART
jgi:hypothetical protein